MTALERPRDASTRVIDVQSQRIGARIRALRRGHGLTLMALAGRTGLSHSFLSQLERGHARPSMVSLERIATALDSTQGELLAAAEDPHRISGRTVLRAGEGAKGPFGEGEARLVTHGDGLEIMEFSGTNRDPGPYYVHEVVECVYLVVGDLLVDLGQGDAVRLAPGDSLTYGAGVHHRWSSPTGAPYRLLVVKPDPAALRAAAPRRVAFR